MPGISTRRLARSMTNSTWALRVVQVHNVHQRTDQNAGMLPELIEVGPQRSVRALPALQDRRENRRPDKPLAMSGSSAEFVTSEHAIDVELFVSLGRRMLGFRRSGRCPLGQLLVLDRLPSFTECSRLGHPLSL
jgi:hypothetical protein